MDAQLRELLEIIKTEKEDLNKAERFEKQKMILGLLAGGSLLALALVAPGVARLGRFFRWDLSDKDDWKVFNPRYLRWALKSLEKQKYIEFKKKGDFGQVIITEKGQKRIVELNIENISISKPRVWDHKWRLVFYDIVKGGDRVRDQFRQYLKSLGFYQLQESVYLHAYHCDREIEFLRNYLGIGQEVRIIVAEKIENDEIFRKYFGV
jgi:hypothetical protein